MAKPRKPRNTARQGTTEDTGRVLTEEDLGNTVTTTNTNTRSNKMGLSAEQIQALLGKTRTKGDYIVKLNEFLAGDQDGVCVNDTWVEMKDKKATTLKQGFENAKDHKDAGEGAEFVKVIADNEQVYLINLAKAGLVADEEQAA